MWDRDYGGGSGLPNRTVIPKSEDGLPRRGGLLNVRVHARLFAAVDSHPRTPS